MTPRTIVVIGAGFSGTVVAARLLRGSRQALKVVLVNRSGALARGVAYGTRTPAHVLNVPAGRMSAYPEDEEHFLRFLQKRVPGVEASSFVPRHLYGEYLEGVLAQAETESGRGVELIRLVNEAVDLDPQPDGRQRLLLADGSALVADAVVLALGHYAPRHPAAADPCFLASPRYIRDPWAPGALSGINGVEPVLLLGTGLTMLDVALELADRRRTATIHALSRRGLLPLGHRDHGARRSMARRPGGIERGPATAKHYLHSVRAQARLLAPHGVDWRDILAALRGDTPELWHRLSQRERGRFLRHVRAYWEVHRHRAAPEPHRRLKALLASGAVRVHAANLRSLRLADHFVEAIIQRRGRAGEEGLQVGWVVNCMGPESDLRRLDEPLVNALRQRGLLEPDPLGLGVLTTEDYRLVGSCGEPVRQVYYVGPLLRAQHWEATAVPELRVHAAALAERLLGAA